MPLQPLRSPRGGTPLPFRHKAPVSDPFLCGSDFWMHITGDENFYHRLAKAFGEVVDEDGIDGSTLILAKVEEIAEEIRLKGGL